MGRPARHRAVRQVPTVSDIADHRALVDGSYYWIARASSVDATAHGIADGDLVEMFNDRGSVVRAAQLTERVPPGTAHSYESAAPYDSVGVPGESSDRGGCVNLLAPSRMMFKRSHVLAVNSCLIEVRRWASGG